MKKYYVLLAYGGFALHAGSHYSALKADSSGANIIYDIGVKRQRWFEQRYIHDLNIVASYCCHMYPEDMKQLMRNLKRDKEGFLVFGKIITLNIGGRLVDNTHFHRLAEDQIEHALKICSDCEDNESVQILQRVLRAERVLATKEGRN